MDMYEQSGVNYVMMDPAKRIAQMYALPTAGNLSRHGLEEVKWSRGESVYLIELPDRYIAHIEEGLGTKNIVAELMSRITGQHYYDLIAQDAVAMIVNDMITLGAMPISVAMHLAAGTSEWFADVVRVKSLMSGFASACNQAGASWGCGEMPTLKGIVDPDYPVLAGSAVGHICPKERLINPENLAEGDIIALLPAPGINANGLTWARAIADKLPKGYATYIHDNPYGEELLKPTPIYARLVNDMLTADILPSYIVNITGHGWRKLMRATTPFVYVIDRVPDVPPIMRFMQDYNKVSDCEMYGNLNMGATMALILRPDNVESAKAITLQHHVDLFIAGYLERDGERKGVEIRPKGVSFTEEDLQVR